MNTGVLKILSDSKGINQLEPIKRSVESQSQESDIEWAIRQFAASHSPEEVEQLIRLIYSGILSPKIPIQY